MPDARKPLRYKGEPFAEEPPIRPVDLPPKPYGLLDRLVKAWRVRVDEGVPSASLLCLRAG